MAGRLDPPEGRAARRQRPAVRPGDSTALRAGDLLLLFTDGLVERRTRDIDEGLALALAAAGELPGHDLDAGLDRLLTGDRRPQPRRRHLPARGAVGLGPVDDGPAGPRGLTRMGRMPGLMLLDTPSLYFRAFYGIPESMTAPDGMPVNAVRGLIDMIATLVRHHSPAELVA